LEGFGLTFGGLDGYRFSGTYLGIESYGSWWSYTEYSANLARSRNLRYNAGSLYWDNSPKERGFSVRCLRD